MIDFQTYHHLPIERLPAIYSQATASDLGIGATCTRDLEGVAFFIPYNMWCIKDWELRHIEHLIKPIPNYRFD